jgi:hypothetical protein
MTSTIAQRRRIGGRVGARGRWARAIGPLPPKPWSDFMKALTISLLVAAPALARADATVVHKPSPISLGWALRPVAPANVVRSDTAIGMFSDAGMTGSTVASTFLVSYGHANRRAARALLRWSATIRRAAMTATALSNPLVGVIWAPPSCHRRTAGGVRRARVAARQRRRHDADPRMASTIRSAIAARSSMDNALFASNDLTPIVGLDVAYVAGGLTVQAEATVFELIRVRGDAVQPDTYKTNFTAGLHGGYFVLPWLSASGELRYQRYLSTPVFVKMDATGASRDTLSAAIGVRGHISLGDRRWLRPGCRTRGDSTIPSGRAAPVVQLDVPFVF